MIKILKLNYNINVLVRLVTNYIYTANIVHNVDISYSILCLLY